MDNGFGERIANFISSKKIRRRDFAGRIGISYDKLQSYIQEKAEPRHDFWKNLKSAYPDADVSYLMIGVSDLKIEDIADTRRSIPVVSVVHRRQFRIHKLLDPLSSPDDLHHRRGEKNNALEARSGTISGQPL